MGYGVAQEPRLLLMVQLLLLLLLWALSYHVLLMASALCFSNQSSALLRFKQGLVGTFPSNPLNSWKNGTDCCRWKGITCDDSLTEGFVTALRIPFVTFEDSFAGSFNTIDPSLFELTHLDLSFNGFRGSIPTRLVELTHLTHLNLSSNGFRGSIPTRLVELTHLTHLDLSYNAFRGSIPTRLVELTHLTHLDLNNNGFRGSIPTSLVELTHLTDLDLSSNHLSGQIPPEISQMTSLVSLDLSDNDGLRLQHPSFAEFAKRMGRLKNLDLGGVNISISGEEVSMAASSSMPNLQELSLENCSIHGPLHESILRLRSLSTLYLGKNNLGYVPNFFWNFTSMQDLSLDDAQLKGKFHWGILQLPQLNSLDLSRNPQLIVSLPPGRVLPESINLAYLNLSSVKVLSSSSLLGFSSKLTQLINLDLSANRLNGTIPSSWASPNISYIYLNNNSLSGPIPEALAKLSSLFTLHLSDNLLNGSIPLGLLNSHLAFLTISNNRLNGWLSHFNAQSSSSVSRSCFLTMLDLSSNIMTGSIPAFICSCTRLVYLDLNNNSLTGTIPGCLTSLDGLKVLTLGRNRLQGSIPEGFTNYSSLNILQLNGNLLVGKIPRSLSNCSSLQLLDLGHNKLEDTFTSWLGHLTQLKVLVLHSNRLHGSITSSGSESEFPLLHIFDIADNRFSGVLPLALFKTFKVVNNEPSDGLQLRYSFTVTLPRMTVVYMFRYTPSVMLTIKGVNWLEAKIISGLNIIDLSSNMFTDEIPKELGELAGLLALNMSHNHLKGPIPRSLGNLHQMESLDLSHNQLTGGIPKELTKLTFLSILNLSFNNLQGSIPWEGQFSTFDDTCFEGNPELCGTKSRPCPVSSARHTPLIVGNEKKHDQEPEWKYIAPELGFVLGLATIILPILFSKRMGNWYWGVVDKVLAALHPRHLMQRILASSRRMS